jgi:hypothetical protein
MKIKSKNHGILLGHNDMNSYCHLEWGVNKNTAPVVGDATVSTLVM